MSDEENGGEPRIGREVTQMMKMLIEDRQRREEEIARATGENAEADGEVDGASGTIIFWIQSEGDTRCWM